MTHCSGCGLVLGWKKFKFHKMWRIPGYYCRPCMLELGKEFDRYAKIKTPAKPCELCGVGFYYLQTVNEGHKRKMYCKVCCEAVKNGVIPQDGQARPPKSLPQVMMIFAGLGVLMMVMGLVFTMMSTGDDASVTNIMFGAVTTALGFVLFRKTIRSRSMLIGGRVASKR